MTRVTITETVVEQLREVVETDEVEDPVNRYAVQGVAHRRELSELAQFVVDADASTYYEALVQAREES